MMSRTRLRMWSLALLSCLAAVALVAAATSASASPVAHAAKSCSPPKYPGQGYFTSLRETGTSCKRAKEVTLAHYRCRVKHGKKGRCTSTVLGYHCTEKRNTVPTEIDARVTCKKGGATVVYTYQQNT